MKCPKCQSDNPDTQSFCGDCGTQLGPAKEHPVFTKTLETPFPQFTQGTSLAGRYEIIEELGKGGMGEVYLAEDTSLKRKVAIKVLPQQFALDKERLSRFEREARLLASLNHPNIATIHGLEKSDDIQFFVMELVEGETLRETLYKGPQPLEEALKICKQIAEGLEAAHEKGIIHRDLKPANIKVSPEGKVKILDFGIAKAFQDKPDDTDPSQSPPITDEMTRPGVILGTAAYMSPEQAKGKRVDKRSDIWAFGCILYECLVGKRLFKGDTVSEMLASILKDEPDWEDLPSHSPMKIRELIARCLVKDPYDRLHDIADARIIIHETLTGTDRHLKESEPSRGKRSILRYSPFVLFSFIIGLLFATFFPIKNILDRDDLSEGEIHRLEMVTDKDIQPGRYSSQITISPDGSRVLFRHIEEKRGIYQRELNQRQAIRIPGTDYAWGPCFSPDGNWIAFFQDYKLKKMPISGGDPQVLCDAVNDFGCTWGANKTLVFTPHVSRGLWQVDENGGEPRRLTVPGLDKHEWGHLYPVFLSDGMSVLFAIWYGSTRFKLALLDLESGEHSIVLEDAYYAVHSPTGHLVTARADGLYAIGFNKKDKSVFGREVPLVRDIFVSEWLVGQFDISRTGTLAYLSGKPRPTELLLVDLKGEVKPLTLTPRMYRSPRYSPDGNKFSVNIYEDGSISFYIVDMETSRLTKLATEGNDSPTVWIPDGSGLTYASDRSGAGHWKTYSQSIKGGEAEILIDANALEVDYFAPTSFSQDGRFMVGQGNLERSLGPDAGNAILYCSSEDSKLKILVDRKENVELYNVLLSPDGRWVLYCADESFRGGQPEQVYVTPFPEGGEKYQISMGRGSKALWSSDSRKIYYQRGSNMMVVDIETEPIFRASSPRILFNLYDSNIFPGNFYPFPNWDIAPDGKHFLMMRFVEDWEPPKHINITTNFFEELKRLVPTEK